MVTDHELFDTPLEVEPDEPAAPLRLAQAVGLAVVVAIVGGFGVGAAEILLAQLLFPVPGPSGGWPMDLLLAAVGRAALTHALFWTPVMAGAGVLYWLAARGMRRARPLAALPTIFASLAGLVVIPADLWLANKFEFNYAFPALVGLPIVVTLVYVALRLLNAALGDRGMRLLAAAGGVLALVGLGVTVTALLRSPLWNPGRYEVTQPAAASSAAGRPNVLWIVLDTIRADHLAPYGATNTPFLTEWAKQSIVFDRAIGNSMWTVPNHASMFTGRAAREHGLGARTLLLDAEHTTVATALAKAGYASACLSNNPLVSYKTGLSTGFDHALIVRDFLSGIRFSLEWLWLQSGLAPLAPWLDQDYGAALTNRLATDWLSRPHDGPRFLFVNYMEAHAPYCIPARWRSAAMNDDQVKRSYALRYSVHGDIVDWLNIRANVEGDEFIEPPDREVLKRQYAAAAGYLDARVRELVELFRAGGLLENTLVVITSDHGEYLETHGMWSHQLLVYEDLTHVPLLLHEPGRASGARIGANVQLSDLHATVLNATLGAKPALLNSRDLLAIAAAGGEERTAVIECYGPGPRERKSLLENPDPEMRRRASEQIAAVGPRYKYIESSTGERELFDLLADPGELNNLYTALPVEARKLEIFLRGWKIATPQYEGGQQATPETLRALKALGYVGD